MVPQVVLLLAGTAVLQQPPAPRVAVGLSSAPRAAVGLSRRTFTGAFAATVTTAPLAAHANFVSADGMLALLKENPKFGMLKEEAPANSLPFAELLKQVKAKQVEGVIFFPPFGDEAYALIDGKTVRIGQGWPIEDNRSAQTPRIVIPILETEGVDYAWKFDLSKKKPKYAAR